MENRSLGMIVVAGLVSLALITTAYAATHLGPKASAGAGIAIEEQSVLPSQDINNNGTPDWQESLSATTRAASSSDAYVAPAGLPRTEALAREIFASYAAAKDGTTFDLGKATASIADSVANRPANLPPSKIYTVADLSLHTDASITVYSGALSTAMRDASQVREYEPATFARAVNEKNGDDYATLRRDAIIYAAIATKLASMTVPTSVAADHLAVVNDIAALSAATKALALWTGDPLDALSAVNAFTTAEDAITADLTALYARVNALEKKS